MVRKIIFFTIGMGGLTYLAVRFYKDKKNREIDAITVSSAEARELILLNQMQSQN